jgi:regulator of sirC expression with transglutaminase-like and TPR domain
MKILQQRQSILAANFLPQPEILPMPDVLVKKRGENLSLAFVLKRRCHAA